ncbi:carbohydrate kinase family protein [Aureimonas sp. AU22]|uniref:carbohydrate kinase family protein n=1 Tax=Aureimonas sp. AU22 TaxID=1638162 RepID=UPI0007851006|nr:carbohydrate kinase family protein [Aureimonas sp. AU22]
MARLAVVGYASIDTIVVEGKPHRTIGGGAVYAALSAARYGSEVSLHVAVGEDFPTHWLRQLEALNIDTSSVERRSGGTRRALLHYGGREERIASTERDAAWWDRTRSLTPPLPRKGFDGYLLCPMPPETLAECLSRASGGLSVADTSEVFALDGASLKKALGRLDVFAPSLEEIRLLTGRHDDEEALQTLSHLVPILVAKRGRAGLTRFAKGERLDHTITPRTAIDPTGAGDATVGALTTALLADLSPGQQLRTAAQAGAEAVGAIGPGAFGWQIRQNSKEL